MRPIDPEVERSAAALMDRLDSVGELAIPLAGFDLSIKKKDNDYSIESKGCRIPVPRSAVEAILLDSMVPEEFSFFNVPNRESDEMLRFAGLDGQPPSIISLAIRRYNAINEIERKLVQKLQEDNLEWLCVPHPEFRGTLTYSNSKPEYCSFFQLMISGNVTRGIFKNRTEHAKISYSLFVRACLSSGPLVRMSSQRIVGKYTDMHRQAMVVPQFMRMDNGMHVLIVNEQNLLRLLARDAIERQGDASGVPELFPGGEAVAKSLLERSKHASTTQP